MIGKLVQTCINRSPLTSIYSKVPEFDAKYYEINDLVNLTGYMVSGNQSTHMIDVSNYYKYVHVESSHAYESIPFTKPDLKYNKLNLSFDRPFASGDLVSDLFKAMLKQRFQDKKEDILDDDPIWINPSDVNDAIYQFLMPFFVCGCWESESKEMNVILNNLNKQVLQDLLDAYQCLKVVYGMTFGTLITSIYAISLINEFAFQHCSLEFNFKEFNPFVYLKSRTPDMDRIYKLRDMCTSMCYITNSRYIDYVNHLNSEFYELFTSNSMIIFDIRVPRIIFAATAGAILSLTGMLMQTVSQLQVWEA